SGHELQYSCTSDYKEGQKKLWPTLRLKQAKPVLRSVYQWSEEAIFTLQDCFETTYWQMFRDAAGTDNEYIDSITSYISKCTDDIVPKINVRSPGSTLRSEPN
ncbi:hypothetical protein NFI96_011528, partial [Prochilodus magdalenae]